MANVSTELAAELFRETGGWFGSPALLTTEPGNIGEPDREFIIDGLTRFEALRHVPSLLEQWRAGKLPHLVFRSGQRSEGSLKLLPRMLVLAGHYDRAYLHTPEQWHASVLDLRAYLRVPSADAFAVYAYRHRVRKCLYQAAHRRDYEMANRAVVRQLRQMFTTADELGTVPNLEQLRRVIFYGPAPDDRRE